MTSDAPRSVVFAYSEVGYVCLEEMIRQGADVPLVFTHIDDPDEEIWFRSVRDLCDRHGIPFRAVSRVTTDDIDEIERIAPDFIFSFYFRAMIPRRALVAARRCAFNMHGALLPKYRGRACINWAVINGETETGATLHVMTPQADRGDIASQIAVSIDDVDTAHDVFLKVAEAARKIIERDLGSVFDGTISLTPQDESQATTFGRRTPADGEIDWSRSAKEIYDLVRGVTHPFPGAFARIFGRKMYVWNAVPRQGSAPIGAIVSRHPFIVGTSKGTIEIKRYQFEGEEEQDA